MSSEFPGGDSTTESADSLIQGVAAAPPRAPPASGAFGSGFAQGAIVGRYRLLRHLGRGGMGTVWEAAHAVSGKRVALKIVRDGVAVTAETRRRFAREARLVTTVGDPGVVDIHDLFEAEDGSPVLVMELLHGETLGAWLRRRPPAREAARILAEVVAIVRAAHRAGVVHRDLKPENIFLCAPSEGGRVRVLDFGIARLLDPPLDHANDSITETGTLVGTPQYMAPEQLFGERVIDERADVWALGVILHECIRGERPFPGNNVGQVVRHLSRSGVPSLDARSCPRGIRALVRAMLTVERDARPRDLERAEALLRAWADGRLGVSRLARTGAAILLGAVALLSTVAVGTRREDSSRSPARLAAVTLAATEAEPTRMTLAAETARASTGGKLLEAFRRAVDQRTSGRVNLGIRWPGVTGYRGGERALVTRLRTEQIDGAVLGARALRSGFPAAAAAALPGVVDSWTKVDWVREHLRGPIESSFEAQGFRLLAFLDEGCERIMSRGHVVRRVPDLAQVRIAAVDADPTASLYTGLAPGIVTASLGGFDVVDALRAGPRLGVSVVAGTAGDAERLQWTKWLDGVMKMPVLCTSGALVLRSNTYMRLDADERTVVQDLSLRLEEELGPRARRDDLGASLRLLRTLPSIEPTPSERREWQRLFRRSAQRAEGTLPASLVEQVLARSREIEALE